MTKKIEDGGPAFQTFRQHALGRVEEISPGMSLRDWFAGQAMHFIMESRSVADLNEAARMSYAAADAMLLARKSGGEA